MAVRVMNWSAIAASFAQPLNGRITPGRKRGPDRAKYRYTLSATRDRLYRGLVRANLRCGEQRAMTMMLNRHLRHEKAGNPLAYSVATIAKVIQASEVTAKRVVRSLIDRGLLRVMSGGVGRGNVRRFAVDIEKLLSLFAPGIVRTEKVSKGGGAYIRTLTVAPSFVWTTGVWGRSDEFRRALARMLDATWRATWKRIAPPQRRAPTRQHFGGYNGSWDGEAVA